MKNSPKNNQSNQSLDIEIKPSAVLDIFQQCQKILTSKQLPSYDLSLNLATLYYKDDTISFPPIQKSKLLHLSKNTLTPLQIINDPNANKNIKYFQSNNNLKINYNESLNEIEEDGEEWKLSQIALKNYEDNLTFKQNQTYSRSPCFNAKGYEKPTQSKIKKQNQNNYKMNNNYTEFNPNSKVEKIKEKEIKGETQKRYVPSKVHIKNRVNNIINEKEKMQCIILNRFVKHKQGDILQKVKENKIKRDLSADISGKRRNVNNEENEEIDHVIEYDLSNISKQMLESNFTRNINPDYKDVQKKIRKKNDSYKNKEDPNVLNIRYNNDELLQKIEEQKYLNEFKLYEKDIENEKTKKMKRKKF